MKHREVNLGLIITILLALLLNSCAPPASALPGYRVNVITGGRRITLPLFAGELDSTYLPNMPNARESSPRILY
jgi:hypothetical protein